jgi:DNA-binding CsgD family transcriptional regulator
VNLACAPQRVHIIIRELIVEGTREGLDAARARGQRLGRPPALTPEQVRYARDLLSRPGNSVASIARLLQVSRSTVYKYVPELTGRHRPPVAVAAVEVTQPAPALALPKPQPVGPGR